MIPFITTNLTAIFAVTLISQTAWASGQESHGGDAIVITDSGDVVLLDDVECEEDFFPSDFEGAWADIDRSLNVIQNDFDLPNLAGYLRSFFTNGRLQWCFVPGKLKDVADEGDIAIDLDTYLDSLNNGLLADPYSLESSTFPWHRFDSIDLTDNDNVTSEGTLEVDLPPTGTLSPLRLTLGMHQIAINSRNGAIKISRQLFNQLKDDKKIAKLFWHEALWHAVGFTLVNNGRPIRDLTNLLSSPKLSSYRVDHFVNLMGRYLGNIADRSPLIQRARLDLDQQRQSFNPFKLMEHDTRFGNQIVVNVNTSDTEISAVTGANPNPSAKVIYLDKFGQLYSSSKNGAVLNLIKTELNSLCKEIGLPEKEWRLPTSMEVLKLERLGLFGYHFVNLNHITYQASRDYPENAAMGRSVSTLLYPNTIPVVTDNGDVLIPSDNLRSVRTNYPRLDSKPESRVLSETRRTQHLVDSFNRAAKDKIVYPIYFCVTDSN